jgi:formate-dependent nitrite reductase membrane component NrfD
MLFMYASLGGITLSLTIRELRGEIIPTGLASLEHGLLVANFFLLAIYLYRMSRSLPAARETLREWLRGTYARAFFGLVLLVGLVATLLLSLLHSTLHTSVLVMLIAGCELMGDFSMMMLKSGLFGQQSGPRITGPQHFDRPCPMSSPVSERSP